MTFTFIMEIWCGIGMNMNIDLDNLNWDSLQKRSKIKKKLSKLIHELKTKVKICKKKEREQKNMYSVFLQTCLPEVSSMIFVFNLKLKKNSTL